MNPKKTRNLRPGVESMETKALMSAGLGSVHELAAKPKGIVVDLRSTQVGADALAAITTVAPTQFRQQLVLQTLKADGRTGKLNGTVLGVYVVPGIGTVRTTVTVSTKVDSPRASDVKISLGKLSSQVPAATRAQITAGVVDFIRRDAAVIDALTHRKG